MIDARQALKACRGSFISIGFFSFCGNILMLSVPLYTLQLFDRVLTSQSTDTLIWLSIAVALALILLGFLEVVRSRVMVRVSVWLDRALGPHLMSHGIKTASLFPQNASLQTLRDLSTLRGFISGTGVFHLFDSPWVPLYLLVIFSMHVLLGVIALIGAVILFILAIINEAATRKLLAEANALAIQTQNRVEANAKNAEVIEAMGMLPKILRSWQNQSGKVLQLQTIASDRAGLIAGITKILRLAIQVTIMGVGVYLAIHQQITPGIMIAASIILGRALAPVEQMIGTWKGFVAARDAYDRINERLVNPSAGRGSTTLPRPKGAVSVEGVTFLPPGSSVPCIQGISFRLEPGEWLGVIGPTASGKSSLARVLTGIWQPRMGNVRLDGADVFGWNRQDFGQYVGYLPQDVELFAGTIKQNIARMDAQPPDEDVVAAAQWAGCHDMVLRLPQGYDTEIGDGGHTLSGGQRQRIALARALYGDIRFLVLDEPNSSLDSDGEQALTTALLRAKRQGITTVMICHRPGLLAEADKLLMLKDGKVAMFGPLRDVMAQFTNARPTNAATMESTRQVSQ
ncbi:MAG: type I secretion system permease/ATPase [Alphaproteobacteria bacterium]|nr:MAG: type I secretion system permease/ATPase [Alphaproteobacteria bacterium]